MAGIHEIRSALARFEPRLVEPAEERRASVAMVLRPGSLGPEVLFIERARRSGDPWSGHMAFPGGRMEACDATSRQAAERETREEVGLQVGSRELLGRLDDLEGRNAGRRSGLVISAFVYHCPDPPSLVANQEVAQILWTPLTRLLDPQHHVEQTFPGTGDQLLPGVVVGEPDRHVVWGLTYRFLEIFFQVTHTATGWEFPSRWRPELQEAGKQAPGLS
jgi:ADP-ribose pyrophosphatase